MSWLATGLAVVVLAGCSLTVRGPAPMQPVSERPDCDRSADGRLLLDTGPAVLGTGLALFTGYLLVKLEIDQAGDVDSDSHVNAPKSIFIVPAVIGGMSIWGMVHNVRATRACERAWTAHDEWRRAQHPEDFPPDIDACSRPLAAWRSEPDLARKTQLWNELPASCQAAATQPR